MTTFHMKQSIAGCLRNNPVGTIDFLEDEYGKPLSDTEARIELNKLLAQGHTVMPVGDNCEGFDVFGGGCPGHEPLKINQSDLEVTCKWNCPNCNAKHIAFGYKPAGKAGLYCVECDVVIDVIDDERK